VALFILAVTVFVGRAYDGWWHSQFVFDDFFSPPHIFVYILSASNIALMAALFFAPSVPRESITLALIGQGLVMIGGLVLDNIWHSNFGLNETLWSAPHSMLQWGWLVISLGLLSALIRMQITPPAPVVSAGLGLLIIAFSVEPVLGPFHRNNTRDFLTAFSLLPTFVMQPTARLTQQLYIDWNLTRANPIAGVMGAVWAGAIINLISRLDKRPAALGIATGLWTGWMIWLDYNATLQLDAFVPLSPFLANWLPLPLFPAAMAVGVAQRFRPGDHITYLIGGVVFAIMYALIWQPSLLWLPLMIAGMLIGRAIGGSLYASLQELSQKQMVMLLCIVGIIPPASFGLLDLMLRSKYL
jgi:hypothetical protein